MSLHRCGQAHRLNGLVAQYGRAAAQQPDPSPAESGRPGFESQPGYVSKHSKKDVVIVNGHGEVTRMSGTIPRDQSGTAKHAERST